MIQLVRSLDCAANTKIANRKNIRPAQCKNQVHLRGPHTNTFNLRQVFDHLFIGEHPQLLKPDLPPQRLFCQIAKILCLLCR